MRQPDMVQVLRDIAHFIKCLEFRVSRIEKVIMEGMNANREAFQQVKEVVNACCNETKEIRESLAEAQGVIEGTSFFDMSI